MKHSLEGYVGQIKISMLKISSQDQSVYSKLTYTLKGCPHPPSLDKRPTHPSSNTYLITECTHFENIFYPSQTYIHLTVRYCWLVITLLWEQLFIDPTTNFANVPDRK